jgi:hypothetical protein
MGDMQAGVYKGKAIAGSVQYGTSSNNNAQIAIDFVTTDGAVATVVLPFTANAAEYSVKKLRACGFEGNDPSNLVGIDRNEVTLTLKYETYQGEERAKWDIMAGGMKLNKPMTDQEKRKFAAEFRSFFAANGSTQGNGAAAPRPAPTPQHERDNQEIPF